MMRALLTLGLLALAGLVAYGLRLGPFAPRSGYEAALDRVAERLRADPDLAARFETRIAQACGWPRWLAPLACRGVAGDVGFELAQKGVARLDRETHARRAVILHEVLATVDDRTCAALGRQQGGTARFREVVAGLSPASLDHLVELTYLALAAELRGTPGEAPSEQEVAAAQVEFERGLEGPTRSRLFALRVVPGPMSDADACWLGRAVYARVAAMREPHRSALAAHLAR